jgi:hypothetical protein
VTEAVCDSDVPPGVTGPFLIRLDGCGQKAIMNARIDLMHVMHVIPEAAIRVGQISSAQQFERMEGPRRKNS